jgi:hypothetical protein
MAKVTYIGPHDAVDVIDGGAVIGTCERGESIEVADELATRLLEQDVWEAAGDAAKKTRRKEA